MGAATAYHLALQGWGQHTVVIERGTIGDTGTGGGGSGLVGVFKDNLCQVRLAQISVALLKDLTNRGLPTGWRQCGSINLARTKDRMTVYRRMKAMSV
jgi:pyruvate dehydrogenase phosphatase regulatory subunit